MTIRLNNKKNNLYISKEGNLDLPSKNKASNCYTNGNFYILNSKKIKYKVKNEFGKGNSFKIFNKILNEKKIWKIDIQKQFQDIS